MGSITDCDRIYIAGPISGIKKGNKEAFLSMQTKLEELGIECFNPRGLEVPLWLGTEDPDFNRVMMSLSLPELFQCDGLVMLENSYGYPESGCWVEYALAMYLGCDIFMRNNMHDCWQYRNKETRNWKLC